MAVSSGTQVELSKINSRTKLYTRIRDLFAKRSDTEISRIQAFKIIGYDSVARNPLEAIENLC